MQPEQRFALEWLQKAQNDLLSAKAVLESPYGITDVPCFHAQQCVEKAFKGWLTWHNMSCGRTHDLMILLADIVKMDGSFIDLREICEELCDFAVEVRYPGCISEPPEGEAERFVLEAEKILTRIQTYMINPQKEIE